MNVRLSNLLAVLGFTFLAGLQCDAADIVWTNTSGGNWGTAANWDPNQVPGAADNAFITNAGAYTVTVSANASAANLSVGNTSGNQTLSLSGGTFSLVGTGTGSGGGRVIMNGGTLSGGTINLTGGATLIATSSDGRLSGVTINGNIAMSALDALLRLSGVVTLNGTITLAGGNARLLSEGNATSTRPGAGRSSLWAPAVSVGSWGTWATAR